MKLKIYKLYILKTYLYYFTIISFIFFTLSFFLNILEEIIFLEKFDVSIFYPFLLTFLNTPSILFELFPFIFLITSQLFFIRLHEAEELNLLKISGIHNFSLLKSVIFISLILGLFIFLKEIISFLFSFFPDNPPI